MAPKAAQEKAKKKAAKQKKILIILAVPMLGALVYAYTTMSGLGGKAQVAATPAASAPATATADTTDAPVTPGISASAVVPLGSFIALGRKDPFNDHGPKAGSGSDSSSNDSKSTKTPKSKGGDGGNGSQPKPPSVPLTGALISINGEKVAVAVGGTFGQAPGLSGVPLFRLNEVNKKSALISVVGTKQHFTLYTKQPLTLQQTGGWTYTLILEPVGSAAPMTVQPQPTQPAINDGGP